MIGFAIGLFVGILATSVVMSLIYGGTDKAKQELQELDNELATRLAQLNQRNDELRKMGENFEKLKQVLHQHRSPITKDRVDMDNATPELAKQLARLHELSLRMAALDAGIRQPNKNQMHALYKNSLVAELKELAKERDTIMQNLWDSGWNPTINVLEPDGSHSQKPLRDLLAEGLGKNEPKEEEKKPRLTLVKDEDES